MFIEGKIHNTSNRKYCIDCSPFGKHNTRKLIDYSDDGKTLNPLLEKQCPKCKRILTNDNFYIRRINNTSPYCKECTNTTSQKRINLKKIELVNKFGNVCLNCHQTFHPAIFDFHHNNPENKEHILLSRKTLKIIESEIVKCSMLCSNCHHLQHINTIRWDKNYVKNTIYTEHKRKLYDTQMYRWNKLKEKAIEYLGNKCSCCGEKYHPVIYEFHHVNPDTKEYCWNKLRLHKWADITKELDKCVVMCSNCHRLEHINSELWNINNI
jgi:uncharacterized C2H2 Zn-finger protein